MWCYWDEQAVETEGADTDKDFVLFLHGVLVAIVEGKGFEESAITRPTG